MALIPWQDQNGDSIVDQNGNDIQFKKTSAQINSAFTITATGKRITPGETSINSSFNISANGTAKVSASASIRSTWTINPQALQGFSKWDTIIFKYVGSREI